MVFAIGWSGVSIASNSLMHLQNAIPQNHMQMMSDQKPDIHADHKMMTSCHDAHMQMHYHEKMLCNNDQTKQQTSQIHCNECSQLLCQNMVAWVDQAAFSIQNPQILKLTELPKLNHQVQHLAGYWQEILRPPKA